MRNINIRSIITISIVLVVLFLIMRLVASALPYALIIIAAVWIYKSVKNYMISKKDSEDNDEQEIFTVNSNENDDDLNNKNFIDVEYKDID